jgi:hypothetical protein
MVAFAPFSTNATILNLKRLNTNIRPKHFCMEMLKSALVALHSGLWLVSLDLKDAYFHASHQSFLQILW